jgi:hypothetical protein
MMNTKTKGVLEAQESRVERVGSTCLREPRETLNLKSWRRNTYNIELTETMSIMRWYEMPGESGETNLQGIDRADASTDRDDVTYYM